MQMSSVCVFSFCPPVFISFLFTPSKSHHLLRSHPPSLNRLGGSSHDQACHPGNYLALSNKAATDSNEEWNIKERRCLCGGGSSGSSTQETERRSESSGSWQRQRSAFHSYINISNVGNRAQHVRVHRSVFICITQPACPLLAAGILDGGCSATSTRLWDSAVLSLSAGGWRFLLRVSPKVRGRKCVDLNALWSWSTSGAVIRRCHALL